MSRFAPAIEAPREGPDPPGPVVPDFPWPPLITPSRAAVTSAAGRGASPQGAATPRGLTAGAAQNLPRSAGRASHLASSTYPAPHAARPADLPAAVIASSLATAPRTIAYASSLAAPSRTTTNAPSPAAPNPALHSLLPTYLPRWPGGSGGEAPTARPHSRTTPRVDEPAAPQQKSATDPARELPAGLTTQGEEI
jgi:hypothetical protein